MPDFQPPEKERGAALLTVLLLVAVMAVIAATMLERVNLAARHAANGQAAAQARLDLLSGERVVLGRLKSLLDADTSRTVDRAGLLGREFALAAPHGKMTARIEDWGNCFNLNSVVEGQEGGFAFRPTGHAQLRDLMGIIGIPEGDAIRISDSLVDWIDSDSNQLPNGAEDSHYLGQPAPHRTAGRMVSDVSELRALSGMTPAIYGKLKPWVCALPEPILSPINVNTIRPEQAPLIAMLQRKIIAPERARAVIAARPEVGFANAAEFLRPFAANADLLGPEAQGQLQSRSRWFLLAARVSVDVIEMEERALIDAQLAPPRIVHRSWGEDL